MPTIVDSLLIELGFDTTKLVAGQKRADEAQRGLRTGAAETAKAFDVASDKMVAGFTRVRNELIGLFALMTAGRGLKDMVADIISGDAATGRLAKQLGMATEELSSWENIAKRSGGTAQGMASFIGNLGQKFEQFKLTGQGGDTWIPWLNKLGVHLRDAQGNFKSLSQLMLDIGEGLKAKSGPEATYEGGQLGADAGTVQTLMQGRQKLLDLQAEQKRLGNPNDADAQNSQNLIHDLLNLQQEVETLSRRLINDLSPDIDALLKQFDAWIQKKMPEIIQGIAEAVRGFRDYLVSIPWEKIYAGILGFIMGMKEAGKYLGITGNETMAFFALWTGAKFLGVLGNINLLRLGLVGIAAALANMALTSVDPSDNLGVWTDKTFPWASKLDDWAARTFGIGRTFKEQGEAAAGEKQSSADQTVRSKQAMDYFTSPEGGGYSKEQAAGIIGNLMQESGLSPTSGAGTAHQGIAQWSAERQRDIEGHFGKSLMTMSYQEQLAAVHWELTQGKYAGVGAQLHKAQSAESSASVIRQGYEVPTSDPMQGLKEDLTRGAYARRALKDYGASPAAPTGPQTYFDPKTQQPVPVPQKSSLMMMPPPQARWGNVSNSNSTDRSVSVSTGNINVNVPSQQPDAIGRAVQTRINELARLAQTNNAWAT